MKTLNEVHSQLRKCKACPDMCGTPVHGLANDADVLLIGQAPGPHEASFGKPFAYTAGKTLFQWLHHATGLEENELREKIYFSAVARCYPGKNLKGPGDREPTESEINNCQKFLKAEYKILMPKLILPVGKVAIREVLGKVLLKKSFTLAEVVGKKFFVEYHGRAVKVIPFPHPSGISRWHKQTPGKEFLGEALKLLKLEFPEIYTQTEILRFS